MKQNSILNSKKIRKVFFLYLTAILFFAFSAFSTSGVSYVSAQMLDTTHDRVQTMLDPGMERIGTVTPRSAREVGRSRLAIGCEMLPRDYGDFEEFKAYIPPLGLARIRLHAGWAKIEKERGVYDFEWLDRQVNFLLENGLEPLLETSYGNSIYPGGGGPSLSDGLPHGEEALAAWDRYVDALSKHYSHVKDWACWNEPNNKKENTPEMVAENNIRTARMIKKNIPDARIAGLIISWPDAGYTRRYMQVLKDREALGLFEWMVYHDYSPNPDSCYGNVKKWVDVVHEFVPEMKIWNGESGATSDPHYSAPISSGKWNTELTQCKWNARRLIGDLGHGYESLLFTFYDPAYDHPERYSHRVDPLWIRTRNDRFMKRMGLVKCNEDFKVLKVKPAYYSCQNIASIFDARMETAAVDAQVRLGGPVKTAVESAEKTAEKTAEKNELKTCIYVFRQTETQYPLAAYWDCSSHPENSNATRPAFVTLRGVTFKEPVWVDVISGAIYAIPPEKVTKDGDAVTFEVPIYDAPGIITEKALVIK